MKIAIISDTHDNVYVIKKFISSIKKQGIKDVIHAGDICAPITLKLFKGINLYFVLGNNDGDVIKLKEIAHDYNFHFLGRLGELIYNKNTRTLSILEQNIIGQGDIKINRSKENVKKNNEKGKELNHDEHAININDNSNNKEINGKDNSKDNNGKDAKLDTVYFAIYHGDNMAILFSLIYSGFYDYVICGHTHKAEERLFRVSLKDINQESEEEKGRVRVKKVRLLNPGGFYPKQEDQDYYYIVVDVDNQKIERIKL